MFVSVINNPIFAVMGTDITGTYKQAKNIFNSLELMQDSIINIHTDYVPTFRKHLTEFIYRKDNSKKFTTNILDNNKLLVKRIK